MEKVRLRNNVFLPVIGAGLWKITDRSLMLSVIENAYQCGYRLFDSAAAYSNELTLGKVFQELQLPRNEVMIQDKLWTTCYGYEECQAACKRSLRKLKMEYLDVFLVHWPASPKQYDNWEVINAETWRGMEQLYKEGYVRAIGVCNYKIHHLESLAKSADIFPFINQIECHPGMLDEKMMMYCKERGVKIQASSPLGNGQLLHNKDLLGIAAENRITVAQLCLRWGLEHGCIVLSKTTALTRMKENFDSQYINLGGEIMKLLDDMPFCGGLAIDSDEVNNFDEL